MLQKLMKITLVCKLLLLSVVGAQAQRLSEPCYFDHYQQENEASIQRAESIITTSLKNLGLAARSMHGTKTIPVVVHIIHNGGTENISDAQVLGQIEVLNEDFRKLAGTNGDGYGVDTEVEFCLAKISPDGNCTDGIVRVQSILTNHLTYQRAQLKQLSYWDNTRYLNMYVVKSINGGSGIAGYSSFPGGPPDEDGIVVRHNYFGKSGTSATGTNGRTTTHEIGHWFGLYHTFNNGCGTDTCTDGDYVCDTPPVANPNFGCPTINSCSNDLPDVNDQIANYCDYSDDACKNMFTAGQKDRVHATLASLRSVIWSDSNLVSAGCDSNYVAPSTCPPIADFTTFQTSICVGSSITYYSRSLNNPDSLSWAFPGGTPSTSTSNNPSVTYTSIGTYSVSLIVSNVLGIDTLEFVNYVTVLTPQVGLITSWAHGFENSNFPSNGLMIDNPDNGITWERTTDAAIEGVASARIQNLINTNYGQSDALLLPRMDFTTLLTPIKLAFKWAYARSDPNYSDELIVLVSSNCGTTWTQKFYRTGGGLVSAPTQTTLFIPNNTQWRSALIDLSTYAPSDHVDIKIVNVTDGGNALYIDSIDLSGSLPVNLDAASIEAQLVLYPNPASQTLQVRLDTPSPEPIKELVILNVLGAEMVRLQDIDQGTVSIPVATLAPGVYFVSVCTADRSLRRRFVKN